MRISLYSARSLRSCAKADMSGLSCKLFPFFPLKPHRVVRVCDPSPLMLTGVGGIDAEDLPPPVGRPLPDEGLDISKSCDRLVPPPKIAETDDCAHRECFRIAEVIAMHSVVINATGLIVIEIVPLSTPGLGRFRKGESEL